MFVERYVSYSKSKQKVMSFSGQESWAKMTSPVGKLQHWLANPIKKVNKAEDLTYLSTSIGFYSRHLRMLVLSWSVC
jgi:hypothetical protein